MASENYKALRFDELPAEHITVLHEVCKQIQKTWGQRDKGMEKILHSTIKKRQYQQCLNYQEIVHISYASKVLLRIWNL